MPPRPPLTTVVTSTSASGADEKREGRGLERPERLAEARVDRRLHADEAAGADADRSRPAGRVLAAHGHPARLTSPPASSRHGRCRRPAAARAAPTPHISRPISARALLGLLGRRFEQQLVVDRQQQASCAGPASASARWVRTIAELDDVGRRALDDRVDGQALAQRPHLVVARPQLGDLTPAAPQRSSRRPCLAGACSTVSAMNAGERREALEVGVDDGLGLLARDVQAVREAVVG